MSATTKPATMKGPAIFLAQFIGDARAVQQFRCHLRLGGRARLQGRAGPDLRSASDRPRQGGHLANLLR